ncbi:MarR family winged helix-turn-helix transcriptional regulator [Jeotgalibacillus terrae]|uniref:MarR family winged helix-turn-helix transcriptional regulator n=1 Tax=Jeotgalibacillus terrae TaxID=587735 RepID=A0ABW5ZJR8_9BACL|nr:MarR family transcriptional regulator [Jeotgalibacillus terrae]MBM7579438.1 DNA-binding MarR family transcriptional regulator [Jeotgalibacillus terrae]
MRKHCSEKGKIIYQLNDIYKFMSPKFERCTGMSQSRLDLLNALFEVDEINQSALQKEVSIDNAAVTRHLRQLEEKGMVSRRKNPADNRVTFVRLTKQGRDQIDSFKAEKDRFVDHVLKDFSEEEINHLSGQLARIQQNVNDFND